MKPTPSVLRHLPKAALVLLVALLSLFQGTAASANGTAPPPDDIPPPVPDFPVGTIVPTEPVGYLPGGGGVTSGGAATYAIPLMVPPGRNGMQPTLAIRYLSGSGNGALGEGFGITAGSSIERCPRNLAVDGVVDGVDWSFADAYCMDGKKLGSLGYDPSLGAIVFHTEQDEMARIEAHVPNGNWTAPPESFRVLRKDGAIYDYLPLTASRREIPSNDAAAVTWHDANPVWLLRKVSDRSGNTMLYEYEVDPDPTGQNTVEYRVARIRYTGSDVNPALTPQRRVEFVYEDRLGFDQPFMFNAGVRSRLTKRLQAVEMYAPRTPGGPASLVHRYNLTYTLSGTSYRALLQRVTLCDAEGVCGWGREFVWDSEPGGLADITTTSTIIDEGAQSALSPQGFCWEPPPDEGALVFDVDGDGRSDALYWDNYECVPAQNPADPAWGKLVWHLKLRLSDTGPLAHEIEVGQASKAVCQPSGNGTCNNPYIGVRLGASRPTDIDGDGAYELYAMKMEGGLTTYSLWRWSPAVQGFSKGPWEQKKRVDLVDLTGDGLVDMFESVNGEWRVRVNSGPPGFTFGNAMSTGIADKSEVCPVPVRATDANADGRGELLVPGVGCVSKLLHFDDSGLLTATDTDIVNPLGILMFEQADLNGDGLRDVVWTPFGNQGLPGLPRVRWNTGAGYQASEALNGGPAVQYVTSLDVNGDGRDDLLAAEAVAGSPTMHNVRLYVSMTNEATGGQFFTYLLNDQPIPHQAYPSFTLGDFDGDGAADILEWVSSPSGTGSHAFAQDLVMRRLDMPFEPDKLVAVRDEGADHAREMFVYSRVWSDNPSAQTCAYPQHCIRHGMTVVREHWTSAGQALLPDYRKMFYSYDRPRMDVRGRGFLGFGEVRTWDPVLFREHITTYDNVTRVVQDGREQYPYAGVAVATVDRTAILPQPEAGAANPSPNGTVRARIVTATHVPMLVAPTFASSMTLTSRWTSVESEGYVTVSATGLTPQGSPTVYRTRSGAYTYDGYGNPLSASSATVGGMIQAQTTTYINDTAAWLIGLPDRIEVVSYNSTDSPPVPRVTDTDYDALGRPIAITIMPDDAGTELWQRIDLVPTPEGPLDHQTVSVATGEPARTTRLYYDAEKVYAQQVKDGLGQVMTTLFEPALGVPVLSIDIAGAAAKVQYDGLGRARRFEADGAVPQTTTHAALESAPGVIAGMTVTRTGDDGSASMVLLDELARPIESRYLNLDGSWSVTATRYNIVGAPTVGTRPGVGAPSGAEAVTTFDTLGRVLQVVAPDGATNLFTNTFFETFAFDPDGHIAREERDIDGRVVATSSYDGPGFVHPIRTQYFYGDFGQLDQVVDAVGNTTTVGYDERGRRTYIDDPDRGPTSYLLNGFGEVEQATDALLLPTVFVRDAFGRVTHVTDSDGTKTLTWDTAPNGMGQLARSESPDGVAVDYEYTPLGQVEKQTWTVDANTAVAESFSIEHDYDPWGRPIRTKYPDVPGRNRFTVEPSYSPTTGHLQALWDTSDPIDPHLIWQVDARNADGALTQATYGNGVVSTRDYDPVTGRLEHIDMRLAGSATPVHAVGYSYTDTGNVLTREDEVRGRLETYEYDSVDRLKHWRLGSSTGAFATKTTTYGYDDLGNLTTAHENGVLVDSASYGWLGKPHALAALNGQGYTYDALGRQIDGPDRTVDYTAFDLPKSITTKGSLPVTVTYDYDAAGQRVRKVTPSETTIYVGGLYERRRSATGIQHVFDVPVETGVGLEVVYDQLTQDEERLVLEEDLLGTPAGVLDGSGVETEQRFADPFGRKIQADGQPAGPNFSAVHVGFTGHEEETETGLINMGGRLYDAKQRRFLTADPFVSQPWFGQSLNRYAYVLNNPLRYTDPNGFFVAVVGQETRGEHGEQIIPFSFVPDPSSQGEIYDDIPDTAPPAQPIAPRRVATPARSSPKPPPPPPPPACLTPTPKKPVTHPAMVQASDRRPTALSGFSTPNTRDTRDFRTAGAPPLPNVVHPKPWAPPSVAQARWEASIDAAANPENPWYVRWGAGIGAIVGMPSVAVEKVVQGVIATPQIAVTEAIATGEHIGRAMLLSEAGADEAAFDEGLHAAQAAATAVASAADTVVLASSIAGAAKGAVTSLGRGGAKGPAATLELAQEIATHPKQTVAVMETVEGPTLVAGGVRDLSAAQRTLASSRGLTPVSLGGFHAEKTLIHAAGDLGLTPSRGVATNNICGGPGGCRSFLEGLGATVEGRYFSF